MPNNKPAGIKDSSKKSEKSPVSENNDLALSEAKFKFIAENTSDGILIYENGFVSYASPAYQKLFGYTEARLKKINGEGLLKLVHPDDANWLKEQLNKYIEGKIQTFKIQYRSLHKNGNYIWREDTGNIIYDKNGQFVKALIIARDISEQKKLEESLKKTLDLLEDTNQMARIGGWELEVKTMNLNWTSVTRDIHELTGDRTPEFREAIDFYKEGENRDTIEKLVNLAIELGVPFDIELQIVTAIGNERWVRAIGKADIKKGKTTRVYGTIQDIDEQRKQRMEMRQSEQRYRSFIENSLTAFLLGNEDGVIEEANEAAVKMFGYSEKELKKIGRYAITDFNDPATAAFFEKRKVEGKNIGEIVSIRKNGERFYCDAYSSIFHGENGEKMYSTFLIDITERKKHILTVEQQYKKLREIGWHQSHVVRGPLARMMGMINLFQYDEIDAREQTIFLNYILEAAHELDGIIKKIVVESNGLEKSSSH